ncbi:hypothetical protein Airi01_064850 [Actinoallomurus iriomotensis]|uniref:Uncharacterized protein n=1 Tax=Actinoallomurus iriomotensis TaxID=478107 RepID=A0A9W6VMZ5_9ACTN|nr:hypothetical protein Airi01_064850 [Actinoallomurus iriomotensis]
MDDDVVRRPIQHTRRPLRRDRTPVLPRVDLRHTVRIRSQGTPGKHHIRSGDSDSRTQQMPAEYPLGADRDHPRSATDRQRNRVITKCEHIQRGRFTWNDG